MKFGKQTTGSTVRFCRIKRSGTKNCRVIWLDNNEEQLLPVSAITECPATEVGPVAGDSSNQELAAEVQPSADVQFPTQLSGEELCRLMKEYQVTTRDLATWLAVPTERVREARSAGLDDPKSVAKWTTMIRANKQAASA